MSIKLTIYTLCEFNIKIVEAIIKYKNYFKLILNN
jgi:hypothetical protein